MGKLRRIALVQTGASTAYMNDKAGADPVQLLELAAHDLRNPISGILAASQYLLDDTAALMDEHHLAILQSIDSSSRSMLRLIEDIVELCGFESGKLRLDIKTTDIQPLVNRAVLLSQMVCDRKKVCLEVEPSGNAPLPPLDIDPVHMLHALESLLTSAIKLARPGSIIHVGAGCRVGRVTIWLRTDGFGISAVALRSLFNPFRRGRTTRPGVEGGTALALAKAEHLIKAHRGVVRVENCGGNALMIKLALPIPEHATARKGAVGA